MLLSINTQQFIKNTPNIIPSALYDPRSGSDDVFYWYTGRSRAKMLSGDLMEAFLLDIATNF